MKDENTLWGFEAFPAEAHSMTLTDRDRLILEKIQQFDGMLSLGQIAGLYFGGNVKVAENRIRRLISNRLLRRPNERTRAVFDDIPIFLAKDGAEFLAGNMGMTADEMGWRKDARWKMVAHDQLMVQLLLHVQEAVANTSRIFCKQWLTDGEFSRDPDVVVFTVPNSKKEITREIKPDGLFSLEIHAVDGHIYDVGCLFEIDRNTDTDVKIARKKTGALLTYVGSKAYKERFGDVEGRILFVTTSEQRALNIRREVLRVAHSYQQSVAERFFFSWDEMITPESVLFGKVWYSGDSDELQPLIPLHLIA